MSSNDVFAGRIGRHAADSEPHWPAPVAAPPGAPNVVYVVLDDVGFADLGCYGSPRNSSPAIDRLAAEGRRFTSFYMASPVCSPSRGALLTGCYPPRIGFGSFEGLPVLFPGQADAVYDGLARHLRDLPTVVLFVSPETRSTWARLIHPRFPGLPVLSAEDLRPDVRVRPIALLGA